MTHGYKIKVYHWGSGSHASNQLYQVEIKVTQQEGKVLPKRNKSGETKHALAQLQTVGTHTHYGKPKEITD